jgi:hypothetical protein
VPTWLYIALSLLAPLAWAIVATRIQARLDRRRPRPGDYSI